MKKQWIILLIILDLVFTAFVAVDFIRIESQLYRLTGAGASVIERQAWQIQANANGTEWEGPPHRVSNEEASRISQQLHTNHEYLNQIAGFGILVIEKFIVIGILAWPSMRRPKVRSGTHEAQQAGAGQ